MFINLLKLHTPQFIKKKTIFKYIIICIYRIEENMSCVKVTIDFININSKFNNNKKIINKNKSYKKKIGKFL